MGSSRKRTVKNNEKDNIDNSSQTKQSKNLTPSLKKSRISPTVYAIFLALIVFVSFIVYLFFFYKNNDINVKVIQDDANINSNNNISKSENNYNSYKNFAITNKDDYKIRQQLDEIDNLLELGNVELAKNKISNVLKSNPKSPRAYFANARLLDVLAEQNQDNILLEKAIDAYYSVLSLNEIPDELYIKTGLQLANRQEFRGWSSKAVITMKKLIERFPKRYDLKNLLGISYMMNNNIKNARSIFKEILDHNPNDGSASVHYGFILKVIDKKYDESVSYLQKGIETNEPNTQHGRFYYHLGDALYRINKKEQGLKLYEAAARKGIFLSKYQRSLYNVARLPSKPLWKIEDTHVGDKLKTLGMHWKEIRDEAVTQINSKNSLFQPETEDLTDTGEWNQLTLFERGRKNEKSCKRTPKTCKFLENFKEAIGCKRGQIKFSIMKPGVHVHAHTGPTNCRIRAHLGLIIPKGPEIRVAEEFRTWKEGEWLIFDDSFEHEVWHKGNSLRLVLIVDVWHPDLTEHERKNMSPI